MKQTRAAVIRRRRLAASATIMSLIIVTVLLATELPGQSKSHSPSRARHNTTTVTPTSSSAADAKSNRPTFRAAVKAYVAKRDGAVSVAVYDSVAKKLTVFHPSLRGRTASIVKVDILETRLNQTGGHLSASQQATAMKMIENSDNDSATALFDQDGEAAGLRTYNNAVGLKQTNPNSAWGLTTTSAADQVTLVRELLHHSTLLTDAARRYERTLMRHVEADQEWGISGGVPKGVVFGNKNGWLPVTEDHNLWAVNSIGWVKGDGKYYQIAVITQHDPTEAYGITTIQHIAHLAWNDAATKS